MSLTTFSMKEADFYKMLESAETLGNITKGYFPTVEELNAHDVEEHFDEHVRIIMFFATDPFKRLNLSDADDEEYRKTVKYCKELVSKINVV